MGAIAQLFESRSTLAAPDRLLERFFLGRGADTYTGKRVDESEAMGYTAWAGAVSLLGETMGSLPLHIFRREGEGRTLVEHPLSSVLGSIANPEMTAMEMRCLWEANILNWGNFYAQQIRDGGGRLRELWALDPSRMDVLRGDDNEIKYLYRSASGNPKAFRADDIFHLRSSWRDSNGLKGIAPLELAREAVGVGLAVEEFVGRFFSNGSAIRGVLQTENILGDDGFERLKKDWNTIYKGQANSHKVAILEQGLKFQPIAVNPKDSQLLELRRFQVSEVARLLRVPPHLLQELDRATFNNIEELGIGFVKYAILHRSVRTEQEIERQLLTGSERKQGLFAKHNLKGLLRGDTKTQTEFYRVMHDIGAANPNDIRAMEDWNRVEGLDVYTIQSNRATPQQIESGELPQGGSADSGAAGDDEDRSETRSSEDRRIALREAFQPVIAESAGRLVNRDVSAVRGEGLKRLRNRTSGDFLVWLEGHREFLLLEASKRMETAFRSFAKALADVIEDELGFPISGEDLNNSADALVNGFAIDYAEATAGQLREIVLDSQDAEEIEQRLGEWTEKRPEKIARRESVYVAGAIARRLYTRAGITRQRWRTVGKNCPLCSAMNGRIVRGQEPFMGKGDVLAPEGANPLTAKRAIKHPPLHKGCDCTISPA